MTLVRRQVATLVARGRLELDTTAAAFRDLAIRNGVREQVLDGDVATLAGELPDGHGDPADRMLVATAILRGLTLRGPAMWRRRTPGDLRVKSLVAGARRRHKLRYP